MKCLAVLLVSALTFLSLSGSVAAVATPTTTWKVEMHEILASTSNQKLNIEYKVFSVRATDSFTIDLLENGVTKDSQSVTHTYGDSGAFELNLPEVGTYTYKIRATNHGQENSVQETEAQSIKIVSAPEDEVRTVVVANEADENDAVQVAGAATAGTTDGEAAEAGENGQTSSATTDQPNQDGSSVLGAETSTSGSTNTTYLIVLVILAALGGLYYRFMYSQGKGPFAPKP